MTLTAAQEIAVIHAAHPLQPQERAAFLDELKTRLAGRSEVGDGELYRAFEICNGSTLSRRSDGMDLTARLQPSSRIFMAL